MKDDKQATFSAASHAQHAADFLHDLQKAAFLRPTRREGSMAKPDTIIIDGHAYTQWSCIEAALAALAKTRPVVELPLKVLITGSKGSLGDENVTPKAWY